MHVLKLKCEAVAVTHQKTDLKLNIKQVSPLYPSLVWIGIFIKTDLD